MRTQFRAALLGLASLLAGSGGCGPPKTPVAVPQEDPAVIEAKGLEKGDGLAKGERKEVKTSHGAVIVSRDANGLIQYQKK